MTNKACLFSQPVNKQSKNPRLWKTVIMISAVCIAICCLYPGKSILCCFKYYFQFIFFFTSASSPVRRTWFWEALPQSEVEPSFVWVKRVCFKPKHVGLYHLHSQQQLHFAISQFYLQDLSLKNSLSETGRVADWCSAVLKVLHPPAELIFLLLKWQIDLENQRSIVLTFNL